MSFYLHIFKSRFYQIIFYSLLSQLICCWSVAAPLPAKNLCIKADIPVLPPSWEAVTWESDGNDLYIIAQAPLLDSDDKVITYKFDLVVTPQPKMTLIAPKPSTINKEIPSDTLDATGKISLTPYKVKCPEYEEVGNIYLVIIDAQVKRVAFKDALILKADDNIKEYKVDDYHWIDDNLDGDPDADAASTYLPDKVKSYPCSYERKKTVDIKAQFKANNPKLKKIWVQGKSTSTDSKLVFEKKGITLSSGVGVYEKVSKGELVNTVRAYITKNRGTPWGKDDPLKIEWEISLDGVTWADGGKTEHTVYVTLSKPNTKLKNRQETIFNLSCRNGNGKSTHKEVFTRVWEDDIDNLEVKRMVGKVMRYWNLLQDVACFDMKGMLADPEGNTNCAAWAELLFKTMAIHDTPKIEAIGVFPAKALGASGFLIAEWGFGKSMTSGGNFIAESTKAADDVQILAVGEKTVIPNTSTLSEQPYIFPGPNLKIDGVKVGDDNLIDGGLTAKLFPAWPYTSLPYTRGIDPRGSLTGTCKPIKQPDGQNNRVQTPQDFKNHAIILYDNELWDPSYGKGPWAGATPNDVILKFENDAIAGYYKESNNFGNMIRKNDPAKVELKLVNYSDEFYKY
ncbi:MAG: hypothetical protein ACI9SQ_000359 [Rubritalea sp.]|jgi:hypothetical protein